MRKYPQTRLRRNRDEKWLRDLLKEHYLTANDLILPIFIHDKQGTEPIKTLPEVKRLDLEYAKQQIAQAVQLGIKAVALFPVVESELKTADAQEALNPNNLMARTLRALKKEFADEIGLIADIALDPYNSLGHDGLVQEDKILNDETIKILEQQAILMAESGADIVAPSDMMDGRIGCIRTMLDQHNFQSVKILSYAVKFASNFYGPFRDAVGSKGSLGKASKESYQLPFSTSFDCAAELEMDIAEGADLFMIKPALPYLDILKTLKDKYNVPFFAYQVSGEYAALKAAEKSGALDYQQTQLESLIACKRAGASAIFCYDALEIAEIL